MEAMRQMHVAWLERGLHGLHWLARKRGRTANLPAHLAIGIEGEDAVLFYKRALSLSPNYYMAWTNLGICYRRLHLFRESYEANRSGLKAAEAAREQNPRRGFTRAYVAYLQARLGHRQLAESEISQAMTFSPDGSEVRWMAVLTYGALDEYQAALSVLGSASPELIMDANRWPDLAGLQSDPRFIQLLNSKHVR